MASRRSSDTPFLGGPDVVKTKVVEHPFSFRGSPDKELTALIVEAVNRMGGTGEEAEERYRRALEPLRERAQEVADAAFDEYSALPEDSYLDRWSLVYLLAELREPTTAAALSRIVTSRIPDEKAKESHDISTVTEEVMIRTTAVEGLVRLSAEEVEEARKALLRHARHRMLSIRRACVQGVMETGSDEDKRRSARC